jgi:hypothetical protein
MRDYVWHWVTCYVQARPGPLGPPHSAIPDHWQADHAQGNIDRVYISCACPLAFAGVFVPGDHFYRNWNTIDQHKITVAAMSSADPSYESRQGALAGLQLFLLSIALIMTALRIYIHESSLCTPLGLTTI